MNNLDLNIENYDLDDILRLFNLDYHYNFIDLKSAFKIVGSVHPDKSKLPSEYFLFFKKAYSILLEIHKIRDKKNTTRDSFYRKEEEILCKKLSKRKDFHKIFNRMFDDTAALYINETNEGYDEWFKSTENENEEVEIKNMSEMGSYFEKKKKESRALTKHKGIHEINGGSNLYELSGKPEEYSSEVFSKLQYEDLKKAHTETVVPVTEEDFHNKKQFTSIDQLQRHRTRQNVKPMNKKEAKQYLEAQQNNDKKQDILKMFNMIKQDQQYDKVNKKWWGKIKQIDN